MGSKVNYSSFRDMKIGKDIKGNEENSKTNGNRELIMVVEQNAKVETTIDV